MQITLKDILTIYWSQVILLIAALGFLIQRILDLRIKKIEMKQSLFQHNRNVAIMKFMDVYVGLQSMCRQILHRRFDLERIINGDYVELVENMYEQLYNSYFHFKLLLDPLEQARYSDLMIEMQNVSARIADVSIRLPEGDEKLLMDELRIFITEKLKLNNENIKVIGQIFRENATKHYSIRFS